MIRSRTKPDGPPFRVDERYGARLYSIGYKMKSGRWAFRFKCLVDDANQIRKLRRQAIEESTRIVEDMPEGGFTRAVKANTPNRLKGRHFPTAARLLEPLAKPRPPWPQASAQPSRNRHIQTGGGAGSRARAAAPGGRERWHWWVWWVQLAIGGYNNHHAYADIIKKLEADGWALRSVRGSHHVFNHPTKPGHITVPHPKKDLGIGLVQKLLKQAGLK